MSLVSLTDLSFTFDQPPLLNEISFEIGAGERIGLLGRNGAGKSTLMKLVAGELEPDDGILRVEEGVRVTRLLQEVPEGMAGTIFEIVSRAFVQTNEVEVHSWESDHQVEKILMKMNLDPEADFSTLSSGMKRRVLLAQALVNQPDVLLLDEPTNHLDIESIRWLENFLKGFQGTLLFVTHDRMFLQALATRIIEVERGRLFDWTCDYQTFLTRKAAFLESEERQQELFDKKLAEEEKWIRQGVKARRTRNEGRVRALKKLREERAQRRKKLGNVRMQASEAERSGHLVIETKDVSFAYNSRPIVQDFSTMIMRGDKLGIVGPNGAGKTTLLKLLLGQLEPDSGSIRHGTKLEVVYFDQLREQIDEEKTVIENVGDGQDRLTINGVERHIYGYLQDFLFTPERARRPARYLSGGERNRMLLARMFTKPSNVLILDEPTNDLDAETLELLEELLMDYSGSMLMVSHDRAFLNNVTTGILAFEPDGTLKEYDGGYDDYARNEADRQAERNPSKSKEKGKSNPHNIATSTKKKLTFKEQKELESLPAKLEKLESEQAEIHKTMAQAEFYQKPSSEINAVTDRLRKIEEELTTSFAIWEDLESRA
ncbi:ATP-binding cassette domain-containing protein [uncultured Rubinisphaera sp.]|uniref:ATP-binding cassette domain-containing protein n=1 Tax=uncultured Rubinisphaera sp. TaxID=1678686 RepID=UPI0030DCA3E8|tara:strand:+ start:1155 stop:2957 length:1803 start_codon:yes stop_codon:yes gene_type:complete